MTTATFTIHVGLRSVEWLPIAEAVPSRSAATKRAAELLRSQPGATKAEVRQRTRLLDSWGWNGKRVRHVYEYKEPKKESRS